ncbi:MAG: PRC-barrel domain-containing protein [Solirubrobacteraceae bacterium]
MRSLVTGSAIRGLPVVTISSGEDVAEVRDVVYSPEAGRVVGLTLNKRGFLAGRRRELLSAQTIHAIGTDAVMVEDERSLVTPEDSPAELGTPPAGRDVTGNEVLTESGASLGLVRDVVVLVGSVGEVVGYEIDTASGTVGYIPLAAQLAVSGSTLVVPDATQEFIAHDLVGLGAAVDEFRSKLGIR